MAEMKNLAKQTAIYGVSSIFGRFLNWMLAPLYTFVLQDQSEYGIYTNIYAWTALLIVILTYGMETGFFRFMNKEEGASNKVYSSVLCCVLGTSVLFAIVAVLLSPGIAAAIQIAEHPDFIAIMCVTVAIDAFCCIPMAYLRNKGASVKFAMVNLIMIAVNIAFNLFFLLLCPYLMAKCPGAVDWFYNPEYSVGYVFVANFISTLSKLLMLAPELKPIKGGVDGELLKKILRYSLPLLILGVAGIMNQTLDKILFPIIYTWGGHSVVEAQEQLGIYGACFKVAMVMMMFTQAFRYAYEPFVFAKNKGGDKKQEYADAMKFFVIFSLIIFLGMVFYLDLLKFIIKETYWEGLAIVPVVLISYLFQGIYFNLSLWYKLTDKTFFGAVFSCIGLVVTLIVNLEGVPVWGYWASAVASLVCFVTITVLSYVVGQRYYPVNYDLKSIAIYMVAALGLYALSCVSPLQGVLKYLQNTLFLGLFLVLMFKRDFPITALPVVGRFFRK